MREAMAVRAADDRTGPAALGRWALAAMLGLLLAACPSSPPAAGERAKSKRPEQKSKYPLQPNPLAGCSLCHVDVEDEYVGSLHFKRRVGCKTCHGPSEGHIADENNEVKPDQVFARKDVDRLCSPCHNCGRPGAAKPVLDARGRPKVCIDCHGHHDQKRRLKPPAPKKQ